jgi:hypothetical protein
LGKATLKARIPPEYNYERGYILNLELKGSDNSWTKLRRVKLDQTSEYSFENVPSGEYSVTLLKNSKYDVTKFDLNNISSPPIILECRERGLSNNMELKVHPNPVNSSLHVHFNKEAKDQIFTYEILTSTGKLVSQNIYTSSEIDVSSLNEGQFYITILDSKGIVGVGKFVKFKN